LKQKRIRSLFLQKTQNSAVFTRFSRLQLTLSLVLMMLTGQVWTQPTKQTVYFHSSDSLLITADDYVEAPELPYVILLHDQGSSRGEFSEIVNRFQKMNFNCLAVDLRNGGNKDFISNETAKRWRKSGLSSAPENIEADIDAAINYAVQKSERKVVLLGAGANGSLALKRAKENENVKAAVALSPGEYFQTVFAVSDTITGLRKPILITATVEELPYVESMLSNVDENNKTIFAPEQAEGERGTKALLSENKTRSEYWLALLLFFKDLQ